MSRPRGRNGLAAKPPVFTARTSTARMSSDATDLVVYEKSSSRERARRQLTLDFLEDVDIGLVLR